MPLWLKILHTAQTATRTIKISRKSSLRGDLAVWFMLGPYVTETSVAGSDRLPDWANINRCSFRRRGARGHGYAAEAVRQLMQIAAEAGVTTIHADTELDNVASQRILHHAGFRKVDEDLELYHYETSTSHERT